MRIVTLQADKTGDVWGEGIVETWQIEAASSAQHTGYGVCCWGSNGTQGSACAISGDLEHCVFLQMQYYALQVKDQAGLEDEAFHSPPNEAEGSSSSSTPAEPETQATLKQATLSG